MPTQIPKLITLAAQKLEKTNPHLFFTFYKNKKLPPELENQYINPSVQKLVSQEERIYLANVKERKETINERSSKLNDNCCYRKCSTLASMALGSGVHLGIYYILRATGTPYSTTMTFLATIPATVIVTGCFSPCASILLSKLIAHCSTPKVPDGVVDLTEVVTQKETEIAAQKELEQQAKMNWR
ncbi:hypothetical protein [Legionella sp. WA2022007384]